MYNDPCKSNYTKISQPKIDVSMTKLLSNQITTWKFAVPSSEKPAKSKIKKHSLAKNGLHAVYNEALSLSGCMRMSITPTVKTSIRAMA
ncbi:hypothetical protein GCM10027516_36670 [Niabella aquatica]